MSPTEVENRNIVAIRAIKPPKQLKEEIVNNNTDFIDKARQEIRDILHGRDTRRMVMIVGPCSIHDPQLATDYAENLHKLRSHLEDDLVVVMRTYLEKPRTTIGWKGLAYDPDLDGSSDAYSGLSLSRQLLVDINTLGIPCAAEFLDPITPQYTADLVSWAAIGARTTESQVHRQLASGLSMPIGFKNSTQGNRKVAVEAMVSATNPHTFFGIDANGQAAIVRTTGNPDTHIVLRGSTQSTNYDETSVSDTANLIETEKGLLIKPSRPIMIDSSHGNSAKDHTRQPHIIREVLEQVRDGQHHIMGFMIESNLYEGQQNWSPDKPLKYGVSITDACIGWEETERLLLECAQTVRPKSYSLA